MNGTLNIQWPKWMKPILLKHWAYIGLHGGRGSGKSFQAAQWLIMRLVENPKLFVVCVRETQKSLKESVKKLLEEVIILLGVSAHFDILEAEIRCKNGNGKVVFFGLSSVTTDALKSMAGIDIAFLEEGQTVSHRSLEIFLPTIRKESATFIACWNPDKEDAAIEQLFRPTEGEAPKNSLVLEVNWQDNPWFTQRLRDDMERQRSRDYGKYLNIWEGQFASSSDAMIFRNFVVKEFKDSENDIMRLGADWGFADDPSTLVRCFLRGHQLFVDYAIAEAHVEIDHLPAFFAQVPDSDIWSIAGDSARPEIISYLKRNGYSNLFSVPKGTVLEGIKFLQGYDIVVHPRCEPLIQEFGSYLWKIDPLTGKALPVPIDKNNHCIDALRYALRLLQKTEQAKAQQGKPVPVVPSSRWKR